ncbi:hypothetical protein PAPYR_4700 [Paratrimastix pyriformis]|uniref:F-box domain-containing protein n=1 Tax=Paratrimastix pyriformis TaxID=342808 RepID=A0ABQ8UPY0_9EUKA|nr:hypothetical protein PAPYR_4700 [Paratrimastix pyriformis]
MGSQSSKQTASPHPKTSGNRPRIPPMPAASYPEVPLPPLIFKTLPVSPEPVGGIPFELWEIIFRNQTKNIIGENIKPFFTLMLTCKAWWPALCTMPRLCLQDYPSTRMPDTCLYFLLRHLGPSLHYLSLQNARHISRFMVPVLAQLPALEILDLGWATTICNLDALDQCRSLRCLSLAGHGSDTIPPELASRLRCLVVGGKIFGRPTATPPPRLPGERTLIAPIDSHNCNNVTTSDQAQAAAAGTLTGLRYLDMNSWSDHALEMITPSAPTLRVLALSSDMGLVRKLHEAGIVLPRLEAWYGRELANPAYIQDLVAVAPNLRVIHLGGISTESIQAGLAQLAAAYPDLADLRLWPLRNEEYPRPQTWALFHKLKRLTIHQSGPTEDPVPPNEAILRATLRAAGIELRYTTMSDVDASHRWFDLMVDRPDLWRDDLCGEADGAQA